MKSYYWYQECPKCHQGRLFIFKDLNRNELYLHCEECETGWRDPNKLDLEHSFLTILEDFEAKEASQEDINQYGWQKFAINKIEE